MITTNHILELGDHILCEDLVESLDLDVDHTASEISNMNVMNPRVPKKRRNVSLGDGVLGSFFTT